MRIIKEQMLNEMALDRQDAIDKCRSLGKKFIAHFEKIYNNPYSQTVHHWCQEMQSWYDNISEIVLAYNKKKLSVYQKIEWFYNFGSSHDLYFNHNFDKMEKYQELMNEIEYNHKSVYEAIKHIFDL